MPRQAVGRQADHEGVEAAPALVAVEQLLVAEVEPEPRAFDQHLRQRRRVAIAEIDALAGDRVDAVRGVADQRQPVIGDPRRMVEAERIGRARREQRDLAEEAAHRRLGFGGEIRVAQRQEPGASSAATDQTIAERWPPLHRRSSAAARTGPAG